MAFFLQECYQVLTVKGQEKSHQHFWKGEAKSNHTQNILHIKVLFFRRKDFTRALSHLGEGQLPNPSPAHSRFLVTSKTKKLRNTCESHCSGIRAYEKMNVITILQITSPAPSPPHYHHIHITGLQYNNYKAHTLF